MVKIKLLEPTLIGDVMEPAGKSIDLTDEGRAKFLIGMKLAEEDKGEHKEDKAEVKEDKAETKEDPKPDPMGLHGTKAPIKK